MGIQPLGGVRMHAREDVGVSVHSFGYRRAAQRPLYDPYIIRFLQPLRKRFRRLIDLSLVGLVQDRQGIFSILTTISQPLRFCSSVAQVCQAGGRSPCATP